LNVLSQKNGKMNNMDVYASFRKKTLIVTCKKPS